MNGFLCEKTSAIDAAKLITLAVITGEKYPVDRWEKLSNAFELNLWTDEETGNRRAELYVVNSDGDVDPYNSMDISAMVLQLLSGEILV